MVSVMGGFCSPGTVFLVLGPNNTNDSRGKPENCRNKGKCKDSFELAALVAMHRVDIAPFKDASAASTTVL
jgi:hypothetical protein